MPIIKEVKISDATNTSVKDVEKSGAAIKRLQNIMKHLKVCLEPNQFAQFLYRIAMTSKTRSNPTK